MITIAKASLKSSVRLTSIVADLSFLVSNLNCSNAPPLKTIVGLPDFKLTISISL